MTPAEEDALIKQAAFAAGMSSPIATDYIRLAIRAAVAAERERREQLEAALRELVEAQEALELALLDSRSGDHDFGALNGRVINAWDKARKLIGEAK